MVPAFASAAEMVAALRPEEPVYCLRPHIVAAAARRFVEAFPGDVLYAVKCNDHRHVLDALYQGGIRHFDTASLAEVAAIHDRFADQTSHYMHPVKSRRSIEQAYYRYGIRSFALDCRDELDKLVATTQGGHDLTLVVRLETSGNQAVCDLSGKFGATVDEAAGLLRAIAAPGRRLGLTFHVGSQCEAPSAYRHAIERAGRARRRPPLRRPARITRLGLSMPAIVLSERPPKMPSLRYKASPRRRSTRVTSEQPSATSARPGSHCKRQAGGNDSAATPSAIAARNTSSGGGATPT